MTRARYIMIGGFLGAGKSTSVAKLAERLERRGERIGLITNDQGSNLVDTQTLRSYGFRVEEIAGGCFCCRFDSLKSAADALSADPNARPDVFIAEPVGSCTDLIATVSYPLRRLYGDAFAIAPLSVVVDPGRALRVLGLEPGRRFSRNVTYVYEKQLEEADLIVINKIDQLTADRRALLSDELATRYPRAKILEVSAREGTGLDEWFDRVTSDELETGRPLTIDYDRYADGEALLGWLNATAEFAADAPVDGNERLIALAKSVQTRLEASAAEIAHFKMTISPLEQGGAGLPGEIGVVNLVGSGWEPEPGHRLSEPLARGQIVINLRAESAPEQLESALREELAAMSRDGVRYTVEHVESFRPGRPEPTHRDPAPLGCGTESSDSREECGS